MKENIVFFPRLAIFFPLLFLLFFLFGESFLQAEPKVSLIPSTLERGHPARVVVSGLEESQLPEGLFDGRRVFFYADGKGRFIGFFGADVMLSPGNYTLKITWPGGGTEIEAPVSDRQYGLRSIKAPQNQVDLSPEDQARAAREKKLTDQALATQTPERLWTGPFTEPTTGTVNSSFGRMTKINGVLRPNPHAGADFKVGEGTPVRAPADGRVILAGDHFFAGNSIYIDHGLGVITMYFHLSEIKVKEGDLVSQGQPIGLAGRTGRVTGAHLHYGLYICGARVDPLVFHKLSGQK